MIMRDGEHADDRQSRRDRHSARRCDQRAQHDNGKRDQRLALRQRHVDDAERAPERLVSYLGPNPSVRQSGPGPAYHGRITKQGRCHARGMLVEATWAASLPRSDGVGFRNEPEGGARFSTRSWDRDPPFGGTEITT